MSRRIKIASAAAGIAIGIALPVAAQYQKPEDAVKIGQKLALLLSPGESSPKKEVEMTGVEKPSSIVVAGESREVLPKAKEVIAKVSEHISSGRVKASPLAKKIAAAKGSPATVIASRLSITPAKRASAGMTHSEVMSRPPPGRPMPRSSASVLVTKAASSKPGRVKDIRVL